MKGTALLYLEAKSFLSRGTGPVAMALLLGAVLLAGWSGDLWRDARLESVDRFESAELEKLAEWRSTLAEIESGKRDAGPYDARPMSISFPAAVRPSSLGDFAIGHAELHPASGEISPWRNAATIFRRYQFDNPTTLVVGRFDLAIVIVMLLPVLMIAVSFDVVARDRSSGTLAMVLSSPVTLSAVAWTRLLFRNGLLILTALLGMLVLLAANDAGGDRYERFALWLATFLAYGMVWITLIACCVARFRTSTGTAAALVSAWLLLVLALPASVETVAEAAFPTPSRLAYLSEIRRSQAETNRSLDRLTEGFLLDHPELSVGDAELPSFLRSAYLSNEIARENTQPIVAGYAAARAGRERTLAWAQLLSPAIVAQRALSVIAGADLGRQHRFQAQASDALDAVAAAVGPAVVSRNRMTLKEFDALSPFVFRDRGPTELAAFALRSMFFLLILGGALAALATRLFRSAERRVHAD